MQLGEGGDEQRARGHVDAVGGFVNKNGGGQKTKGAGGVERGPGTGADAGGGEAGDRGNSTDSTDVAGGGDVVEAPPTKPE